MLFRSEVGSREVPESEDLVHGDGGVLDHVDHGAVQSRGNEVLRASWVVSRIEVVLTVGDDFDGRQRTWSLSRVND